MQVNKEENPLQIMSYSIPEVAGEVAREPCPNPGPEILNHNPEAPELLALSSEAEVFSLGP